MKDRLQIIWNKRVVSTFNRHQKGRVVFQYSQDWIEKKSSPVSLSLPCRKKNLLRLAEHEKNYLYDNGIASVIRYIFFKKTGANYLKILFLPGSVILHRSNFLFIDKLGIQPYRCSYAITL
jgi:HipA-like protein